MAKAPVKASKNTSGVDDVSKGMIYDGATISQLCELFHMDFRTLTRRLRRSDVKPSGKRNSYDIYKIHEVAPWVLPPKMDIEEYIKNMNPQDLPKMLTKEFWAGVRSRQAYLREAGELWSTSEVQSAFSEIIQILVMNARVIEDEVDRKAELNARQRVVVKDCIEALMTSSREKLAKHFEGRKPLIDDKVQPDDGCDEEL